MPVRKRILAFEARFNHRAGGQDTVGLKSFKFTETDDERIGTWEAELTDLARAKGKIKPGDDVEFWVRYAGEGALSLLGRGWVGPRRALLEAAMLGTRKLTGQHWEECLQWRFVTKLVKNQDAGAAIHEALTGNDLGLTLGGVPNPFGVTIAELRFDHETIHEFLTKLAKAAGAGFYVDKNKDLQFYLRGAVASGITETGDGGVDFDIGDDSSTVENVIRGFGGTLKSVQDSQTTQTGFSRATTSTPVTKKVANWPREEMVRVRLFVRKVATSTADLEVRLEADNAGARSGVDLVRTIIPANQLPADSGPGAWVDVDFPTHILAPGNPVHVVIFATGVLGVDVGVDGGGNLAYEAFVGIDLVSEVQDSASITSYGRREGKPLRDPNVLNRTELDALLNIRLAKFKKPLYSGGFEAIDPVYLTAVLGRTVLFQIGEIEDELASKALVLKERVLEYADARLSCFITVADGDREMEEAQAIMEMLRRLERVETATLFPKGRYLQQLLVATDSLGFSETATVTSEASGSYVVGSAAKVGFADVG